MSKVKFNADEMMVMAMFEQPTRTETMRYIEEVVPFVEDDVEVFSLVASTMKKMRSISDMEFPDLTLNRIFRMWWQNEYQSICGLSAERKCRTCCVSVTFISVFDGTSFSGDRTKLSAGSILPSCLHRTHQR